MRQGQSAGVKEGVHLTSAMDSQLLAKVRFQRTMKKKTHLKKKWELGTKKRSISLNSWSRKKEKSFPKLQAKDVPALERRQAQKASLEFECVFAECQAIGRTWRAQNFKLLSLAMIVGTKGDQRAAEQT